jgi:hypothetical protein
VRPRLFIPILVCLAIAVAWLGVTVWIASPQRRVRAARISPSRVLADTFIEILCRVPSDSETVNWDSRPLDRAALDQTLAATAEARRVREIRSRYFEVLRRQATRDDCGTIQMWVDRNTGLDEIRRDLAANPEARRVVQVRQAFIDTLGRDPREWDDASLRHWVDSPYTIPEIRSRLIAQRPLVGVHYFMWYLPINGWGNGLTSVAAEAPRPLIGPYDSSDTDVIATQIKQMEDAGFDFALVHIVFNGPRTWTNARIFMDRLSGHRLKAAIVIDGLYTETPAAKAMWVQKVKDEYAGDSHYLRLYGQPLIVPYSTEIDFDVPGVILRNMYWTSRYDPGSNSFNPSGRLEPRDWAFWAPVPQPLTNGMVPVIPGYTDASLGRPRTMVYARDNGRYYGEQWRRALALHPELIVVYGWNEYFEQTAIEPTTVWGYRYLELSACYIAHAHRGTVGTC